MKKSLVLFLFGCCWLHNVVAATSSPVSSRLVSSFESSWVLIPGSAGVTEGHGHFLVSEGSATTTGRLYEYVPSVTTPAVREIGTYANSFSSGRAPQTFQVLDRDRISGNLCTVVHGEGLVTCTRRDGIWSCTHIPRPNTGYWLRCIQEFWFGFLVGGNKGAVLFDGTVWTARQQTLTMDTVQEVVWAGQTWTVSKSGQPGAHLWTVHGIGAWGMSTPITVLQAYQQPILWTGVWKGKEWITLIAGTQVFACDGTNGYGWDIGNYLPAGYRSDRFVANNPQVTGVMPAAADASTWVVGMQYGIFTWDMVSALKPISVRTSARGYPWLSWRVSTPGEYYMPVTCDRLVSLSTGIAAIGPNGVYVAP